MRNVLTSLRRTRRVASVIAALLATGTIALAAQSQPPAPEPRRTDRVTDPAENAETGSNSQEEPSAAPAIAEPFASGNAQQEGAQVTAPDEQQPHDQSVTVRSLPTIQVGRGWIDYSQIGLTLLLIALGVWQLVLLRRTVRETRKAADAATKSADVAERSLLHLNRAYLTTEAWKIEPDYHARTVKISFDINNPSRTAARLERIEFTIGSNITTREIRTMVAPNERYALTETTSGIVVPPIDGSGAAAKFSFEVSGRIAYTDIFRKTRHRRFARSVVCPNPHVVDLGMPDVPGANDEEDWEQKD